ncbi:hypothetical protein [Elizabethkingia miricola]|uniref:hypothetical protein n=1 Tax=Elizabethkingia miricola TaxID=172045 RepID=UPI000999160B|nr:hypothetical protein [Elizabethkingia miricola]OPC34465.1 hypothetical protein BAX99_06215 [Elizabethkingia miricola]
MKRSTDKLNSLFIPLRVNFRKYGPEIAYDVFYRFHPTTLKPAPEVCVFCNSSKKLTKEHVIPKWLFQNNTGCGFEIATNNQFIKYNHSVVPACDTCNNSILAEIEKNIILILSRLENSESYKNEDLKNIIRWLEILEYKLQVFQCRLKFIKYGSNNYSQEFGVLQVAWMRHFWEMNPFKALSHLKFIQKSITIKEKSLSLNSLVIFTTKDPHHEFFHQPSEYIFISFPMFKIAIFYFFRRKFDNLEDCQYEAIRIMKKIL